MANVVEVQMNNRELVVVRGVRHIEVKNPESVFPCLHLHFQNGNEHRVFNMRDVRQYQFIKEENYDREISRVINKKPSIDSTYPF